MEDDGVAFIREIGYERAGSTRQPNRAQLVLADGRVLEADALLEVGVMGLPRFWDWRTWGWRLPSTD